MESGWGDKQGAWEEEGGSAMPLAANAPLLSQASGRLPVPLPLPGDKKG